MSLEQSSASDDAFRLSASSLQGIGVALCRMPSDSAPEWGLFTNPSRVLTAYSVDDVLGVIGEVESAVMSGFWAAGFVVYEAGPAFDSAQRTHPPDKRLPLAWFGIYDGLLARFGQDGLAEASPPLGRLRMEPECGKDKYCGDIAILKGRIDAGDVYQVNHTLRLRGKPLQNPSEAFLSLASCHPAPYMGWIDCGGFQALSMSPELFLERRGCMLATEPMKGTASRCGDPAEDALRAEWLSSDEKNRAENLMIVDMSRNDLGRICRPGSIKVPSLFSVSSLATVHQMSSRVEGELGVGCGLAGIFKATFPAASITGAPKIMSMQLIADTESSPRGIYTGCIGCVKPGGDFIFNVAIRTVLFEGGVAELGAGGGIVADSVADLEWEECLAKTAFIRDVELQEDFDTLETILWSREDGFTHLQRHLERACRTQAYFSRGWSESEAVNALEGLSLDSGDCEYARVRLLVARDGSARAEYAELKSPGWADAPLKVNVASGRVDSSSPYSRHKTTLRRIYDESFREALESGFGESILLNERGEIAEGCISSVSVKIGGEWTVPPLDAGILPGIWRAVWMESSEAAERVLTLEDLEEAEEIRMGNSVRGAVDVCEVWSDGSPIWRRPRI